jgi:hypothetical protein
VSNTRRVLCSQLELPQVLDQYFTLTAYLIQNLLTKAKTMVRACVVRAYIYHSLGSQAPRGLSAEEKRVKLLEIFHETVSFHQYGRFTSLHSGHMVERLLSGESRLETRRISTS